MGPVQYKTLREKGCSDSFIKSSPYPREAKLSRSKLVMTGDSGKQSEGEFQDEEEKRLQNDKPYVIREFSKICLSAVGIGVLLFFYDILVSLMVLGIGAIYAIAVLLEIKGADGFITRIGKGLTNAWNNLTSRVREGYRVVRREVRRGLED